MTMEAGTLSTGTCQRCGQENEPANRYCGRCGEALAGEFRVSPADNQKSSVKGWVIDLLLGWLLGSIVIGLVGGLVLAVAGISDPAVGGVLSLVGTIGFVTHLRLRRGRDDGTPTAARVSGRNGRGQATPIAQPSRKRPPGFLLAAGGVVVLLGVGAYAITSRLQDDRRQQEDEQLRRNEQVIKKWVDCEYRREYDFRIAADSEARAARTSDEFSRSMFLQTASKARAEAPVCGPRPAAMTEPRCMNVLFQGAKGTEEMCF
jgi:hypothetical protein